MALRIGTALACVAAIAVGILTLVSPPSDPTGAPAEARAPGAVPGPVAPAPGAARSPADAGTPAEPRLRARSLESMRRVTLEDALRADGMSEEEIGFLGGTGAAAEPEADWDTRFRAYLVHRDVLAAAIHDPEEREREIESLRLDWFTPEERERARQLEGLSEDLARTAGEEEEVEAP